MQTPEQWQISKRHDGIVCEIYGIVLILECCHELRRDRGHGDTLSLHPDSRLPVFCNL